MIPVKIRMCGFSVIILECEFSVIIFSEINVCAHIFIYVWDTYACVQMYQCKNIVSYE
jgi:hypothetical protein